MSHTLVLLRHGESTWNKENRFTGWTDVDLSEAGMAEAHEAGRLLREAGFEFDVAYTSVLRRAIRTLWIAPRRARPDVAAGRALVAAQRAPLRRPPGPQQGRDAPSATATSRSASGAAATTSRRRRSTSTTSATRRATRATPGVDPALTCRAASRSRTPWPASCPYWHEAIAPAVRAGRRVLIAAHGNSLRALVKYLDDVSDEDIVGLNIPTGIPLVYELDDDLRPLGHRYLGDRDRGRRGDGRGRGAGHGPGVGRRTPAGAVHATLCYHPPAIADPPRGPSAREPAPGHRPDHRQRRAHRRHPAAGARHRPVVDVRRRLGRVPEPAWHREEPVPVHDRAACVLFVLFSLVDVRPGVRTTTA